MCWFLRLDVGAINPCLSLIVHPMHLALLQALNQFNHLPIGVSQQADWCVPHALSHLFCLVSLEEVNSLKKCFKLPVAWFDFFTELNEVDGNGLITTGKTKTAGKNKSLFWLFLFFLVVPPFFGFSCFHVLFNATKFGHSYFFWLILLFWLFLLFGHSCVLFFPASW